MRIGVIGGTFNPVHYGHLIAGMEVKEKMSLKKIIFIPSALPPHKGLKNLASAKDRLAMVKLALRNNPYFFVSTLEIDRGGKSYSVETIKALKELYGKRAEVFFILGVDAVKEIFTWKKVDEFLSLCRLIVLSRPGYSWRGPGKRLHRTRSIQITPIGISSSLIRERIKEGKSISFLVPERVEDYIRRHHLYKCG